MRYQSVIFKALGQGIPPAIAALVISVMLMLTFEVKAQIPGLKWAINAGGTGSSSYGNSTATDINGNVYVAGTFSGTVDFDPGPGSFEISSSREQDAFILKLDANGGFVWVKNMGLSATSVVLDGAGNIYVTGISYYDGNFGTFPLTNNGHTDIFICKLDPNGNFIWAKGIGGPEYEYGNSITLEPSADGYDIYITGSYQSTVDFDPNAGVTALTSVGGTDDVFVLKINHDGNFLWARSMGGTDFEVSNSIIVHTGNIFITGSFYQANSDDADFDPGFGTFYLTSNGESDIFISSLTSDGDFVWAKQIGGLGWEYGKSITTDASGNIYSTGSFYGSTVDFDPGVGITELTATGNPEDIYILKLDPLGDFVWAKGMEGIGADSNSTGAAITLDIFGNVYLAGHFVGEVDFDPDVASTFYLTSDPGSIFISKYSSSGDFVWASTYGGSSNDVANSIRTDITGNIYVTGSFEGTNADFDPSGCISFLDAIGSPDIFIQKIGGSPGDCLAITLQPLSATACVDTPVSMNVAAAGTTNITYRWQKFQGSSFVDLTDQLADGEAGTEGYIGTDTPVLTVTAVDGSGTGDFRCIVSGDLAADVYSDIATLTYQGGTSIPYVVANSGCGPGQFLITATGGTDGNYTWYDENGDVIKEEVNSTYTTPFISAPTKFSVAKRSGDCVSTAVDVEVNTNACAPVPGLVWVAQPEVITGSVNNTKMAIDASGNIYATGYFIGTVDFDSGTGTGILTTAGAGFVNRENFLLKLTKDRDLVWVKSLNSPNNLGNEISIDGAGNIYLAGYFSGIVDFDPGTPVVNMTATGTFDTFITKLDTDGNFIWTKRMGGTGTNRAMTRSVASDANGVYITGDFQGTVDFDPNAGVFNLTSAGSSAFSDIFICKLDPSGNIAVGTGWAHRIGASSATDGGVAIKVDASGNVYSTGRFFGSTTDFDPGTGTATLPAGGATDFYIHKLNNAGLFQWAATLGGTGVEISYALALDAAGDPHIATTFGSIITLLKYTADGILTWTKNVGGFGSQPNDLTVDASGNVLMTGHAEGNYDFDPGATVYKLKSNVTKDMIVIQLDSNGNFSWTFNLASTGLSYFNNEGLSIVTDTDGSIYTAGAISHSSDLDPGHCTYPLFESNGGTFIQKIKPGIATLCFNLQPVSDAVCAGASVSLIVAATGTTSIAYQWQKLNTGTGLFEDITDIGGYSGTTSSDLLINTNGSFGAGSYQCKVSGDNASIKNSSIATLTVNEPTPPPTVIGATSCAVVNQTLTASGSTDGNYRWYDVDTGGTAISGEVNSSYVTPPINTTTTYYVSIDNGTCESSRTPVEAEFNTSVAAPTTTGAASCTAASLLLSASGGINGQYLWYTTAAAGTAITGEVNSSYTTPSIGTTTTYYVSINDGTCESSRTSVVAQINNPPSAPTTTGASSCNPTTLTLNASGGVNGQYRWYTLATGGIAIAGEVNSSYTTPSISSTATYYVSINDGACESSRTAVAAQINTIPTAPTTTGSSNCIAGSLILNAAGGTNGQYRWYTLATGGTAIAGEVNSSYPTPSISSTTTYYVSINDGTCESSRATVVAIINTSPVAPTTTGASGCAPASVTLTASGGTNGQYRWYTVAIGGTAIAGEVNSIYVTPILSNATTYYVAINDGACESQRTAVMADVTSCASNLPPIITSPTITTQVEGKVTINFTTLISDPDNNLDITTLRVIIQPESNAVAFFDSNNNLIIDYKDVSFSGKDHLTIEVCDLAGSCSQQVITVDVVGDVIVYNAISLNGDDKNPALIIKYIDILAETQNNKASIYNRWGDLVWEGVNYNNSTVVFTGYNKNGNELPSGTYFYKIEFNSGRQPQTGYLSLKR